MSRPIVFLSLSFLALAGPGSAAPESVAAQVLIVSAEGTRADTVENARRQGLLVVDLSDDWAPFLFSESDGDGSTVLANDYRKTFVALANDAVSPDELVLESPEGRAAVLATVAASERSSQAGELSVAERRALARARAAMRAQRKPNFLEVFGIPPTLSVLARRIGDGSLEECTRAIDLEGLRLLDSEVTFQSREQARREYEEAIEDAAWLARSFAGTIAPPSANGTIDVDPQVEARLRRARRAEARLRAVRATQARLECEGLLSSRSRYVSGAFDLATHESLAQLERKNDVFGWGFISGETREMLLRSPAELSLETFRRILAERIADAAAIVEDGSASRGEHPATYTDAAGQVRTVRDLIGEFVDAAMRALRIGSPQELVAFLRTHAPSGFDGLRIAFAPPTLPPYYSPTMDLSVEIDRGDVWYDFPFDARGTPQAQRRHRYPSFTLYVTWREQKIPLVRWRTTIGSWRSELGKDGQVYLRYKNSDVGPRIWKDIVAAPAWVPPTSTPGRDLLTRKVFDPRQGPVTVVNTEVMGPGFASAYGLGMAIHLKPLPDGGLFDNQIRTHGSVDYTSIARRFSHGCHRLVNKRAVWLFDFLLRHRNYRRLGDRSLKGFKRRFVHQGQRFEYELRSRGYYYELRPPIAVKVLEGRILGEAQRPIQAYFRKPGVDYGTLPPSSPVEPVPVLGP